MCTESVTIDELTFAPVMQLVDGSGEPILAGASAGGLGLSGDLQTGDLQTGDLQTDDVEFGEVDFGDAPPEHDFADGSDRLTVADTPGPLVSDDAPSLELNDGPMFSPRSDAETVAPATGIDFGDAANQTAATQATPPRSSVRPKPRKKSSPLGTILGVIAGPFIAAGLAYLVLAPLGKVPNLGFWPFVGNGDSASSRSASTPMPIRDDRPSVIPDPDPELTQTPVTMDLPDVGDADTMADDPIGNPIGMSQPDSNIVTTTPDSDASPMAASGGNLNDDVANIPPRNDPATNPANPANNPADSVVVVEQTDAPDDSDDSGSTPSFVQATEDVLSQLEKIETVDVVTATQIYKRLGALGGYDNPDPASVQKVVAAIKRKPGLVTALSQVGPNYAKMNRELFIIGRVASDGSAIQMLVSSDNPSIGVRPGKVYQFSEIQSDYARSTVFGFGTIEDPSSDSPILSASMLIKP